MDKSIGLQDIYFEMAKAIKATFPKVKKIYQNRVKNLSTPSFFVQLISYASPAVGPKHMEKRVKLDLTYFTDTREVDEAFRALDKLSRLFAWGLRVYKRDEEGRTVYDDKGPISRFLHIEDEPSYELIDNDLHYVVVFSYVDEAKPIYVTHEDQAIEGYEGGYPSEWDPDQYGQGGKEVTFKEDEDGKKRKNYIDEDIKLMEYLYTDIDVEEEKRKDE